MNRYAFLSIWKAFVMIYLYSKKQTSLWINVSTTDTRTSTGNQLLVLHYYNESIYSF